MDLIDAIINDNVELVQQLLEEGCDPNIFLDEAQVRPLHFAAQSNSVIIGKLLFKAGADLNVRTVPDGLTPLDVAKMHDNKEFVEFLTDCIKQKNS